ncbi:MAG TPA: pyridoxamine 5'-phosphate oxidase family protein [Longimicrobiales bacterium]|nr:pyridoxamine 5'-phosphate oxidase family protein [Longimicrobiales bacterium]
MKKIEELYELIEGIEIAMFTTRREDGQLVSRPMATQARSEGADLWFATDLQTHKMDELRFDEHVNVSYYKDASREFVSVSGTARVVTDRNKIIELWRPDWKAWFSGTGEHAGTANDPRIALIAVEAESVMYMKNDKPRPVVAFEVVKAIMTGSTPDVGEIRQVSKRELSAKD